MHIGPLLIGSGCAAVAQFLALAVAGAGHGWAAPFFYSPLLFIVYPLVLTRLMDRIERARWVETALLSVAIVADLRLAANALGPEASYLSRVMTDAPAFLVPWLCLWSAWQILTIWLLMRNLLGPREEEPS